MKEALIQLQDVLADLYPTNEDARRVAVSAGLRPSLIAFSPRPINTWFAVVTEADNQDRVGALVEVALNEYPSHRALILARHGKLTAVRGPEPEWETAMQPEDIVGGNDLLPVSFLALGLARAAAVVRIAKAGGSSGTGFLFAAEFLLTNHHVLPDADTAAAATVEFNYQQTPDGADEPITRARLDPGDGFATSPEDDWTAVRIAGGGARPTVPLAPAAVAVGGEVFIIQHAGGGPKQVALHNNTVMHVGERRMHYLTDTMPGSSGSPVFDREWKLVALHRSGGWVRERGAKTRAYRNEGVLMSVIAPALRDEGFPTA